MMAAIIIRKANYADLASVLDIYSSARDFMALSGNPTQWNGGYPSEELIRSDIEEENLFVAVLGEKILGVFYYRFGEDPTYKVIYDGEWKSDLEYGVIHRIAVSDEARGKGIVSICFDYCFELCKNLRIDTHTDNLPMRKSLMKNGFEYCGIIRISSGEERIAFQKCK